MFALVAKYALPVALSAALVLALALGWAMWSRAGLVAENERLRGRVAALEWSRDQAREAARVADAYRKRATARADRLDASIETLLTGDLDNAYLALDPRITRILECLHDGNAGDCANGPR